MTTPQAASLVSVSNSVFAKWEIADRTPPDITQEDAQILPPNEKL